MWRRSTSATRELELLAAVKKDRGTAGIGSERHDGGDEAEGDGVVHTLALGVERLGGLALVEVVDQPSGEAATGAGRYAAGERVPRREGVVAGPVPAGVPAGVPGVRGVPRLPGAPALKSTRSKASQEISTRP